MTECKKCNGKGFIESGMMKDARFQGALLQCSGCGDVGAYSAEVMRRAKMIEGTNEPAKVLQFRRRVDADPN